MSQEAADVAAALLAVRHEAERGVELSSRVHRAMRERSRHMREGNFAAFAGDDVELLFDLTDGAYFGGKVRALLAACKCPISFHASTRLTRSGGLTKQFRPPRTPPRPFGLGFRYEIVLSSTLLLQTFKDVDRPVRVSGLPCADRLEAAQRIMEHEATHLVEMLAAGVSSCDATPFKLLALRWFGHTETKHDLVTQSERARETLGVRVGGMVTFAYEGRTLTGLVNRITRRATVLVEDPSGVLYTSGKRYLKYYVPLSSLRPA